MPSDAEIEAAAIAIADHEFGDGWKSDWYKGDVRKFGHTMDEDFIGLARAALEAAEKVREPVVFVTAEHLGPPLRCTVNGPQHIVVERVTDAAGADLSASSPRTS